MGQHEHRDPNADLTRQPHCLHEHCMVALARWGTCVQEVTHRPSGVIRIPGPGDLMERARFCQAKNERAAEGRVFVPAQMRSDMLVLIAPCGACDAEGEFLRGSSRTVCGECGGRGSHRLVVPQTSADIPTS